MPTYRVAFNTGANTWVEVDADDEDAARTLADEQFTPPRICAQCQGWGQDDPGIEVGDDWEQDESAGGVYEL